MALQTAQFVMRTGPNPGKIFPVTKDEIFIGRDASCDVVINDAEISRKHARLSTSAGGYVLEDLGSTNGTFVNGQRLMGPHSLRSGELIMLGENVSMSFEAADYDPGATMISGGFGPQANMPEPHQEPFVAPQPPAFHPQPQQPVNQPQTPPFQPVAPPPPAYVGQVPAGPLPGPVPYEIETPPAPPRRSGGRTWLLAGCGCLIILLCIVVVVFFLYVDAGGTARWCQFFPFLTNCSATVP